MRAAVEVGFGVVGFERNGLLIAIHGGRVPVELAQRVAAVMKGFGAAGLEPMALS